MAPPRILYANLLHTPGAVLVPSSEELGMPRAALLRPGLTDILRWKPGWDVRAGENDRIDFDRGGVKVATIVAGNYATPALYAAAIVSALNTADAGQGWACSQSATTHKFTISATPAFALKFATGANLARSAHPDLGYASTDKASATSHLAEKAALQSRRTVNLDAGPAVSIGEWMVASGVNDRLDIQMLVEGVLALTVAPGLYTSAAALAVAIYDAWVAAGAPATVGVTYDDSAEHFQFESPLANAHTLLTGTGANLAQSLWADIGFNTGSDSTTFTYHESHNVTVGTPVPAAAAGIIRGHSVTDAGVVKIQGHTLTMVGLGLGAAVAFSAELPLTAQRSAYFAAQARRYWRLIIEDVPNAAGYLDLGVWFVGTHIDLPGFAADVGDERDELSTVAFAIEGAHTTVRRASRRVWDLELHRIDAAKKAELEAFADQVKVGGAFFFNFDSSDITNTRYVFLDQGVSFKSQDTVPVTWNVSMKMLEVLG